MTKLVPRGGVGTLYEAEHTAFQTKLNIKALHPDEGPSEEAAERFHREAFVVGQLSHPCVVKRVARNR